MCSDSVVFFFFNDTATTDIYTLSLHDALPIYAEFPGVPAAIPGERIQNLPVQDRRLKAEHRGRITEAGVTGNGERRERGIAHSLEPDLARQVLAVAGARIQKLAPQVRDAQFVHQIRAED